MSRDGPPSPAVAEEEPVRFGGGKGGAKSRPSRSTTRSHDAAVLEIEAADDDEDEDEAARPPPKRKPRRPAAL